MAIEPHIAQPRIHNGRNFSFLSMNNQLRNGTNIQMAVLRQIKTYFFFFKYNYIQKNQSNGEMRIDLIFRGRMYSLEAQPVSEQQHPTHLRG